MRTAVFCLPRAVCTLLPVLEVVDQDRVECVCPSLFSLLLFVSLFVLSTFVDSLSCSFVATVLSKWPLDSQLNVSITLPNVRGLFRFPRT